MTVHVSANSLKDHKVRDFKLLIDGEWTNGTSGRMVERVSPVVAPPIGVRRDLAGLLGWKDRGH